MCPRLHIEEGPGEDRITVAGLVEAHPFAAEKRVGEFQPFITAGREPVAEGETPAGTDAQVDGIPSKQIAGSRLPQNARLCPRGVEGARSHQRRHIGSLSPPQQIVAAEPKATRIAAYARAEVTLTIAPAAALAVAIAVTRAMGPRTVATLGTLPGLAMDRGDALWLGAGSHRVGRRDQSSAFRRSGLTGLVLDMLRRFGCLVARDGCCIRGRGPCPLLIR